MDYLENKLSPEDLKKIDGEVAIVFRDFSISSPLKEEVFKLLEESGTLIFYPFEEYELWGLYYLKNDRNYYVINSRIEIEKQIFAAGHEFAHSRDIARTSFECITSELLTEYVNNKNYDTEILKKDSIANRFSAELLVDKKELRERYEKLPTAYDDVSKTVLMSDEFLVPYRTIVKRFYETKNIDDEKKLKQLLSVSEEEVKKIAERYECCQRNFEISNKKTLGGYLNKALLLYENDLSTYKELKSRLKLINKTPDEFSIIPELDNYE